MPYSLTTELSTTLLSLVDEGTTNTLSQQHTICTPFYLNFLLASKQITSHNPNTSLFLIGKLSQSQSRYNNPYTRITISLIMDSLFYHKSSASSTFTNPTNLFTSITSYNLLIYIENKLLDIRSGSIVRSHKVPLKVFYYNLHIIHVDFQVQCNLNTML